MAKKLNSVLGVDIGSRQIKVAEVKSQGREPVVTAVGLVETPEGAVDHTGIFNPDAVSAALKQAISDAGVTAPNVVVSIAGQASVLVRTLEVPRMNATELREHMAWEISRNIPFAESNVVSDYRPLADDDPNSANMDVVMAISPQSAIDTVISTVKGAKKAPAAIDVEPLSLARALTFNYGEEFEGQTVCVVDLGHKTTAINIYRDGKLLMPRQIPFGGEMVTKALADALAVSVEEAEQVKFERCQVPANAGSDLGSAGMFDAPSPTPVIGAATEEFQPYNPFADDSFAPAPMPESSIGDVTQADDQPFGMSGETVEADAPFGEPSSFEPALEENVEPPRNFAPAPIAVPDGDPEVMRLYGIIAPAVEEFVAEVRRSVDYFRSRGGEIDRILLSGGGTRMKGVPEHISKSLGGVPCDTYDCFRRLKISGKRVAPGFAEEHRQEFAVAIGNALHIFVD